MGLTHPVRACSALDVRIPRLPTPYTLMPEMINTVTAYIWMLVSLKSGTECEHSHISCRSHIKTELPPLILFSSPLNTQVLFFRPLT